MIQKIRFLHIPKTAGTTFDECLFRQYLGPYLLRRQFVFSGNIAADQRRLAGMPEAALERIAICTGHAPLVTGCQHQQPGAATAICSAAYRAYRGTQPPGHRPLRTGPGNVFPSLAGARRGTRGGVTPVPVGAGTPPAAFHGDRPGPATRQVAPAGIARALSGPRWVTSGGWRPGAPPPRGRPGCWCHPGWTTRSRRFCAGSGA